MSEPSSRGGLPPELLGDDIPEAVLDELLVAFADRTGGPLTPTKPKEPQGSPARADAPTPTQPADPPTAPPDAAADEPKPSTPVESVVVIEADDLPDAVTLDGDPSTGGPAVIDSDAAVDQSLVHPRFRARRIAVRRAEGRRRLRWFVVGGIVVLVVLAVLALLASPLFDIERVDVEGNVYADPAAIQAVVDDLHGDPILTADLDGARDRIEAIPWVKSARVTMHFPHRVTIEILERTPVASFMGTDGSYRVVDADGFVVAVLGGEPIDYPPITGILPNPQAGESAGAGVVGAAQLIAALPQPLADRLTSVDLGEGGLLTLHLSGASEGAPAVEIDFGTADDYRDKLIALLTKMSASDARSDTHFDVSQGEVISS